MSKKEFDWAYGFRGLDRVHDSGKALADGIAENTHLDSEAGGRGLTGSGRSLLKASKHIYNGIPSTRPYLLIHQLGTKYPNMSFWGHSFSFKPLKGQMVRRSWNTVRIRYYRMWGLLFL